MPGYRKVRGGGCSPLPHPGVFLWGKQVQWFQHSVDSHDDPDIADAIDMFGDAGYMVFFIMLELYAREFNQLDSEGWWTISKAFVRRKLRKSWTKAEQILNFYSERQRIMLRDDDKFVSINIPKMVEIASNWTKRPRAQKGSHLCRPSVVPTAIEEEEKKNIQKDKKKAKKYTDEFLGFWSAYPKKKSIDAAYRAWDKRKDRPPLKTILGALAKQKESKDWTKDGGQFIPYPATWLNGGRWEDETDHKTDDTTNQRLNEAFHQGQQAARDGMDGWHDNPYKGDRIGRENAWKHGWESVNVK